MDRDARWPPRRDARDDPRGWPRDEQRGGGAGGERRDERRGEEAWRGGAPRCEDERARGWGASC